MREVAFIAYISVYRGSGRPDRPVVQQVPALVAADGDWAALEYADPCAAHDGALPLGVFHTWEEANECAQDAWESLTEVDSRGYTQWAS